MRIHIVFEYFEKFDGQRKVNIDLYLRAMVTMGTAPTKLLDHYYYYSVFFRKLEYTHYGRHLHATGFFNFSATWEATFSLRGPSLSVCSVVV